MTPLYVEEKKKILLLRRKKKTQTPKNPTQNIWAVRCEELALHCSNNSNKKKSLGGVSSCPDKKETNKQTKPMTTRKHTTVKKKWETVLHLKREICNHSIYGSRFSGILG